uniref:Uncharacterized protein n=1 Tax=Cucumis melo TaxID=3656 RepID=A0A9I9CFF6_CUCME
MASFDDMVRLSAVGRHGDRRTDVRWQGEVSALVLPSAEEDEGKGKGTALGLPSAEEDEGKGKGKGNGKGKRNGKRQW